MQLTWKRIAAGASAVAALVVTTAGVTGAGKELIELNPLATKGYVASQLAGGFEPIQKLLMEQKASIDKGFADVQWTATIDRYNTQNRLFQIDDAALQADMKSYDTASTAEKRLLDRRVKDLEERREALEQLRCKIDQHDANAVC